MFSVVVFTFRQHNVVCSIILFQRPCFHVSSSQLRNNLLAPSTWVHGVVCLRSINTLSQITRTHSKYVAVQSFVYFQQISAPCSIFFYQTRYSAPTPNIAHILKQSQPTSLISVARYSTIENIQPSQMNLSPTTAFCET